MLMLDRPIGRLWYAIAVPVCVDVPFGHRLIQDSWPPWLNILFFVSLMTYGTSRRFLDAGLQRWWAVPYSIFALSPYGVLYFNHNTNVWLVTLAAVVLQIPAMLWKPARKTASTAEPG